jgi:FkbM family methyltransferase
MGSLTHEEHETIRAAAAILPPDAVWVDGGSAIGEWASAVLAVVPRARVRMVDPNPAYPRSALVDRVALWSEDCERDFYTDTSDPPLGSSLVRRWREWGLLRVQCRRLDGLFDRIDFLKLDVEGAEHEAILGLGALRPAVIQFEYGGTWSRPVEPTLEMLADWGYLVPDAPASGQYANLVCWRIDP